MARCGDASIDSDQSPVLDKRQTLKPFSSEQRSLSVDRPRRKQAADRRSTPRRRSAALHDLDQRGPLRRSASCPTRFVRTSHRSRRPESTLPSPMLQESIPDPEGNGMENVCRQFWICNAVPPEWHWLLAAIMPLLLILLVAVPIANVLHRAGHSRWWTVIVFVPVLNLIALWGLAFGRWPKLATQPTNNQNALNAAPCNGEVHLGVAAGRAVWEATFLQPHAHVSQARAPRSRETCAGCHPALCVGSPWIS